MMSDKKSFQNEYKKVIDNLPISDDFYQKTALKMKQAYESQAHSENTHDVLLEQPHSNRKTSGISICKISSIAASFMLTFGLGTAGYFGIQGNINYSVIGAPVLSSSYHMGTSEGTQLLPPELSSQSQEVSNENQIISQPLIKKKANVFSILFEEQMPQQPPQNEILQPPPSSVDHFSSYIPSDIPSQSSNGTTSPDSSIRMESDRSQSSQVQSQSSTQDTTNSQTITDKPDTKTESSQQTEKSDNSKQQSQDTTQESQSMQEIQAADHQNEASAITAPAPPGAKSITEAYQVGVNADNAELAWNEIAGNHEKNILENTILGNMIFQRNLIYISPELQNYVGQQNYLTWYHQFCKRGTSSLKYGFYRRYLEDYSANLNVLGCSLWAFIQDFQIPKEDFIRLYQASEQYPYGYFYQAESKEAYQKYQCYLTDAQVDALYSGEQAQVLKQFKGYEAVYHNDQLFPYIWFEVHTAEDYLNYGFTVEQIQTILTQMSAKTSVDGIKNKFNTKYIAQQLEAMKNTQS